MKVLGLSAGRCRGVRVGHGRRRHRESSMINKETNGAWYFQPEKPKAKHIKADVPGDYAFRVKATKGSNPWDVQASSPVAGAINEGDVIMLNYFARAEEPAEGGSSLTARIQLAARRTPRCST